MSNEALQKGASHYLEGRPITWGINYFKDEPLAMEVWLLGWCSEALKDYRDISNPEDPFAWKKQRRL